MNQKSRKEHLTATKNRLCKIVKSTIFSKTKITTALTQLGRDRNEISYDPVDCTFSANRDM